MIARTTRYVGMVDGMAESPDRRPAGDDGRATIADVVAFGVPERHASLLLAPLVGVFTTVGPAGVPQSTAVWYHFDDHELRVSVRSDRQKLKNLALHPVATLFIVDPADSVTTLEIRAKVRVRPDHHNAQSERFSLTYGRSPSKWDPEGVERMMLTLDPIRIVTLG